MKSKELLPQNIVVALDHMMKKLREEENPEELKIYRRFFKKKVPFNLRGYLIGYLLKDSILRDQSSTSISKATSKISTKKRINQNSHNKSSNTSTDIKRLFVSIGRNKRVNRNEIIELFISKTSLTESDFGEIRILNYYSFVEVPRRFADDVIFILSGINFKGRKITVDFAREKN